MKKNKKFSKIDITNKTLNLPVNYKELFKFTYKTNIALLVKLSLLLAFFIAPLFVAIYLRNGFENSIYLIEGITTSQALQMITSLRSWYSLIYLACFMVFSVGLSGAMYIMRRQLWGEGVSFWRDFYKGLKENWLKYILITLFFGSILCLFNYLLNVLYAYAYLVLLVVFILISIFLTMMMFLCFSMTINYKVPFLKMIKNSFLMMNAMLPYAFSMLLLSVSPLIICIELYVTGVWPPILIIGYVLYICLGLGHAVLTAQIFNFYIFDETVNKRDFPEAYRRGLFHGDNQVQPIDEGFHK